MKRNFTILLLAGLLANCSKDTADEQRTGVLKDLTSLDGCGWVIEIQNRGITERLLPGNLGDFDIALQDGLGVELSYRKTNSATTCMAGPTIEILKIRSR